MDICETVLAIDALVRDADRLAHALSSHLVDCRADAPRHGALNHLRNSLLDLTRNATIARGQLLEALKASALRNASDAADLLQRITNTAPAGDVNRPVVDRVVTKVGAVTTAIAAI